jgi:hypothetical protein
MVFSIPQAFENLYKSCIKNKKDIPLMSFLSHILIHLPFKPLEEIDFPIH